MRSKTLLQTALALSVLVLLVGCSTFGSRYQTLHVSSDPPGAEVLINGQSMGVTPATFQVRRNRNMVLEVRGEQQTIFRTLSPHSLSSVGTLDMMGCALIVPLFGLLSDAAWDYDQSAFGFHLKE